MSMNRDDKLRAKMQTMTSAVKGKQTNTMKLPALERMTNSIKTTADTKSGRGSLNGGNVTPTVKTAPRQSVREHSISGVNISKQTRQNIGLTKTPKTSIAAQKPTKKDKNYIVKRDRYDELMQDNGLANDIKTLAEVNYNNANQDATVSKEWAEEYGAKAITGGLNKKQYLESLSRRYNLTPKELEDMALTFHSDANKEEVADYGEGLKEFAEEHPVLGSAGSFVGTLGSGIEGMYNVLAGSITGDDRYLSNMFQTTKKSPREGAKENIDSGIGKGAYDIGMGIGDMAAGATTGSAPAILAGNTANEALESSLDRNNSVRQASIYGAGAGALDYITESIGLGKADDLAVNGLKQAGLKQFLKNSAKAGKEELTENVIQNIGQQVLDAIVNDENAELNLSYRNKLAKGEDEISAFLNTAKEYSAQLGFDALLGYGMGSFMQGGASILPALSGMLNNKTSGAGKIPTEDVEIQKIAQDYQNAADEMARLQSQLPEVQNTTEPTVDPAFELASRVAAVSGDFDAYNSMDNMYEMDSFVDQLADEIRNGRDLSGLIEIMEDSLDDAGELEVRNTMQDVINELYRYNEGRGQDGQLSPEEVKVLQDVVDGKYDIPETGETEPRSYKDLIPENAYFNSDSFRALADNAKEVDQKLTNLKNTRTQLEELLAKETIGPKPEEEWTPDEYIKSLGFLGEKPMLYTPEGEKIRKSIANVDNEIHTLRAREEEIREGKTALKNKASKEQLANYTFKAPTPATQTEYPGFDITKATHNDEVQDAINNGTAFIAEMSPLEYLDRAAHEIFTDSTLESTIMSANSLKEVSQYADAMRNGAQFPILDLRYNSKSGRGQEGLTRALAAYEAGIDKVPVAIIGEPSLNPYNGRPDDIEIDDFGIPEADINEAVAEAVAESYAQDNALTPEEIDYLNNHMETLDDEIVPIEEETKTPDNGYWLRILGDPNFLAEQAQAQGVNPQTLVNYANQNLGLENIPRVTPNVGNVPPDNDIPAMDGVVPGRHTKTSQTYTNTGKNGGGWTEEEYNKYTDPSQFQYNDVSEQESVDNAIQMRTTEGREGFKNRVMAKEKLTGSEIDGLMMEWRDLTREARELEESGKDAAALWAEGVKVFRKVQEQESHNAQALQVLAKWSRNTPEGMLVEAENIVNGKTKPEQSKLQKELEKLTKGKKKFQFSDNFVAEFLKEAEEIQALTPNSPLAKDRMAELGRKVNRQLPSTLGEKLTSFLMDNMLGNFRTLITRNAGGNVGLNAIEQLVQRPVAAGIDMLASVRTGKRTQAGLSREGLAEYIQGFTKGLQDELHDLKTGLHTARTGENTIERAIQANRHVFREGGPMDRWDSLIKNGLSVGDRPFYEAVYKQTLGDYNRLRAAGKMGDVVQGLSDTDFNKYAETAAKLNALAAVYQNDSKLADALLGFKKSIGDLSRGIVGVDVLSQFSMPFVKTPANVVDVGVSYSPIGVVRNAFRTGKEIKDEAFDQNRFANETARNILGTAGLTAGGIALAKSGVLSGAYSKDKDEKQAQKEAGEQEYAWNVPEILPGIGGKQMDISWLPAVGANLVSAAAAYDAYENGDGNVLQNLVKGAEVGGQAMFDQSMFQGLQRLFGTGETYNSDEGIVANMGNVVKSGLSQFVPSLARQVGQVMDPYQRDVGNSNEGKSFGPLDSYGINNIANTIPKVREKALAPKVNTSGELMKENQGRNVGMKVIEDMILPGKLTDVDYSRLSEEAMRLSNLTTNKTAFMPKADRKSVDTETHTLSNQEWVDYQQKYYKTLTNAGEKLLDSTYYKDAETSDQEKLLANTYSDLRSAINSQYNGKEVDGAAKRYIDAGGGEKGVLEVLKYEMNSIEANKLDMTVPTYEKKQAEYPGGAKKYAENKKKADALGLTVDTYDKKEAEYQGGAKQYAADKKKADELGITVDQFNKAKNNGGAEKFAADKKAAEQVGFVTKDGTVQTKEYQKAIDKAGKQWRKMETDLPVLVKSGLDKSAIYTYGNALNSSYASTINPSQYAREYNMINTNKDNGMTQNEVLDYLNKGSYTQEEADRLWTIYGDGWKQVPVLKGGKWSKKKKK